MNIIIDANITSSAGNSSMHPQSRYSRNILKHIMEEEHITIILDDRLLDEYKRNNSSYGKSWYISMISSKRVKRVAVNLSTMEEKIDGSASISAREKIEAKKDCHLIMLCNGQNPIISIETNSRAVFQKLKPDIAELKNVVWVSPITHWEECLDICSKSCNLYKYVL